jgi:Holliday junction resolvasome RuvABC endonuclease subunit
MIVVGIDYSLTSPAVCVARDETFSNSYFYFLNDRKSVQGQCHNILGEEHQDYLTDQQRYENIASWVLEILSNFEKEKIFIMIEDYSFGSKGKVFNLAENCGILKYMLYKQGYRFFTVPPTVVKKFATGKGNATKEKMYEAFVKDTFVDLHSIISPTTKLGSPTTDIVDAWYIARYMIHKLTEAKDSEDNNGQRTIRRL